MTEVFYYHPPGDMDDDAEREAVTCSVARNSMYTRIERFIARLDDSADHEPFIYRAYFNGLMESQIDLYGYSRRTGVRKRPDLNPAFHYHVDLKAKTGEIVWNGKTYPAPETWRPSQALRRRRGTKPRRNR